LVAGAAAVPCHLNETDADFDEDEGLNFERALEDSRRADPRG